MQTGNSANKYDELRKNQIVEATEELVKSMPFDSVTVTAICKQAGMSRPTFYRYFEDKFDVVQWAWNSPGIAYLENAVQTTVGMKATCL